MSRRDQITLTDDEQQELLDSERIVTVATQGTRGWPHLMPLWYVVRDGEIWIYTYAKSQKVRNLERDPKATLLIETGREYTELRGAMIEAEATVHRDFDLVYDVAKQLTLRYADGLESIEGDAAQALAAQARKRVAVQFKPVRTATWDHRKLGGTYCGPRRGPKENPHPEIGPMKILVTGAGGMLGQDVVRAAERAEHEVRGLARAQLDITDAAAVEQAIADFRPAVVINCAAWTDVDGAEAAEEQATAVNAAGARNVAAAADAVKAKVVYVSTDFVFDGEKSEPYVESDEPAPLSAYGHGKLAGETETAAANARSFIVRSAWLFGAGGRNFVETMLQLAADLGEVLVVRDQVGSPTYTGHLAQGIVRLIEREEYGIHHIAAAGHCSRYEQAREIFDKAHVECNVLSATTEMMDSKARAPRLLGPGKPSATPAITLPWRGRNSRLLAKRLLILSCSLRSDVQ